MKNTNNNISAGFNVYKELNQARKDYHKKLTQLGYIEISILLYDDNFDDTYYVHNQYIELFKRHTASGKLNIEGAAKELGINDLPKTQKNTWT